MVGIQACQLWMDRMIQIPHGEEKRRWMVTLCHAHRLLYGHWKGVGAGGRQDMVRALGNSMRQEAGGRQCVAQSRYESLILESASLA